LNRLGRGLDHVGGGHPKKMEASSSAERIRQAQRQLISARNSSSSNLNLKQLKAQHGSAQIKKYGGLKSQDGKNFQQADTMPNDSQNNTLQSNTFDHSIQHESKGELEHDASPSLFGPAVSKAAGGQHSEHNASPGFNNFLYQFATRTKLDDRGSDVMRNRKSPY